MRKTWLPIVLSAILLLQVWLISHKELSFDEAFSIPLALGTPSPDVFAHFNTSGVQTAGESLANFSAIRQTLPGGNPVVFLQELNTPLYFWLLGLWLSLTSLSSVWLRIPSLMAGLGSLYCFYRLLSKFISPRQALWGAAFMGGSSIYLFYSTLARPYIWTVLLALLAINALLEKRMRLYSVYLSLGILTHMFLLFLIPAQGLASCQNVSGEARLQSLKRWAKSLILPAFVTLTWLALVFSQQAASQAKNAIFTPLPLFKLLWHHVFLSRWIFYCDTPLPRWPHFELDYILSLLLWVLLGIYGYRTLVCQEKSSVSPVDSGSRHLWLLGSAWFFLPLLLLTLIDQITGSRLSGTERYLSLFSPGLIMMVLATIASSPLFGRQIASTVLGLLLGLNTGWFLKNEGLPTERFHALANRIQAHNQPTDLVLAMVGYPTLPILGSYLPPDTAMATVRPVNSDEIISIKRLQQLTRPYRHVWLVVTYGQMTSLQPQEETLQVLNHLGFQITSKIDLGTIRLGGYLLSRR
jgi:uncharacterized membrane protein